MYLIHSLKSIFDELGNEIEKLIKKVTYWLDKYLLNVCEYTPTD